MNAALWGTLLAVLGVGGGCSRTSEPKLTGNASAPPVSLQCVWQPGYAYRLHFEMEQVTDLERPEPNESSQHRVTFDQDYLVKVTAGARAGALNLDMEVLSLGMERANAGKKALSFDSEQGGETLDELGYIPVLKKLVGGHLRFQVSSNGNVLRADGISEWLERALRSANASGAGGSGPEDSTGPEPAVMSAANVRILRQGGRNIITAMAGSGVGGKVGSTLRSFFTQDHFKQMLEFPFLPPGPVRVGEAWPARGDTPITTRGRLNYEASCKFEGWQMHLGTNSARIAVEGNLTIGNGAAAGAKASGKTKTLHAKLWINTSLQFPITMVLEKQTWLPPDPTSRLAGTNRVNSSQPQKTIHQRVATTLLWAAPSEAESAAGDSKVK